MNVFFILAIGLALVSIPVGLFAGMQLRHIDGSRDWYLTIVGTGFCIAIFLAIIGLVVQRSSDVTLYDIEIRVHYVDGYSKVIRRDSITELPSIEEYYCHSHYRHSHPTGTYSLYIEDEKIPGVVRFEYLKKRQYQVPYSKAYK